MKLVTYRENDLYSVVCALGIIAQSVDRETAVAAIVATVDVSEFEAAIYLDNPASAAEFRSAWAIAVGNSIVASAVASAQREQTIGLLHTLTVQMHAILQRLEDYETREAVAALQGKMLRLVDHYRAVLAERGQAATDEQIAAFLFNDGDESALELRKLLQGVNDA